MEASSAAPLKNAYNEVFNILIAKESIKEAVSKLGESVADEAITTSKVFTKNYTEKISKKTSQA